MSHLFGLAHDPNAVAGSISGLLVNGTNTTVSGAGTAASPYAVNASGGSPGGSPGDIQYNNGGVFAGDTATTDGSGNITANSLALGGTQWQLFSNGAGHFANGAGGFNTDGSIFASGINVGFTTGSVVFEGASGLAQDNANFFWDETDKFLGLGTTTPPNRLSIYSTGIADGLSIDGTNAPAITLRTFGTVRGYAPAVATGASNFFLDSQAGDFIFRSEANNILFGRGGGNSTMAVVGNSVGIGTTTPPYKLSLYGDTDNLAKGPLYIAANGVTNTIGTAVTMDATAVSGHSYSFISTGSGAGAGAGYFAVYDGTAAAYRFSIDPSGNVGIGTTSPSSLLTVNGDAQATNIITPSINIATTSNFSIGNGALANGGSALAFGAGSQATGLSSIAIGVDDGFGPTIADAEAGVAIGSAAYADGYASTAIGAASSATNNFAVAIGSAASSGNNSVAIGTDNAAAYGDNSIVIGTNPIANADSSMAFGSNVQINSSGTHSMGIGLASTGNSTFNAPNSLFIAMTAQTTRSITASKVFGVLGGTILVDPLGTSSSGAISASRCALDAGRAVDAILFPNGTTAQRSSSPINGMERYNSSLSTMEEYVNGSWNTARGIVTKGDLLAQSAAVSSVMTAYTTPNDSTTHTFRVNAYTAITAISAGTLTVQVSFTDENNTARTISYFPMGLTSAGLTTTGFDAFTPCNIRCKPNTAITLLTTFTGVSITYDVGGYAELIY
jgi:hypothetical protein